MPESLASHLTDQRDAGSRLLARLRAAVGGLASDGSHAGIARRTALFAFGIRVASAAIAYVAQIILARWIGTFDYGIYVFVWTWVLVLGNLSGLGFGTSATRFVPEYIERGEPGLLRGFLIGSRLFSVLAATAVAAAGLIALHVFHDLVTSYYLAPLFLACFCLPLFTLTETQDGIARCFDAPGIALIPPYILRPLLIFAVMWIAHRTGIASDASTALGAAIVATWLAGVVQLIALQKRLAQRVPTETPSFAPWTWLSTSLPVFVADGARVLLANIDVLLLSAFAAPDQVGIYYAVTKTLVLGAFVPFAVGAAVTHRYSEYHVAGEVGRLQDFIAKSAQWTFWPTLGAVALMVALGKPFLWLFGPSFVDGYPLMLVLSVGVVVRAAIGPAERLLATLGGQATYARTFVTVLLFGIALQMLLVPRYGALGSAIAVALTALIETALLVWLIRARLKLAIGIWVPRGLP